MMVERHTHSRFWLAIVILALVTAGSLVTTVWVSGELDETRARLTGIETELAGVGAELQATEGVVEDLLDRLSNLQVNYERLTEGYPYVLRDPSYREMKAFLARDKTSDKQYVPSEFTCVDYAAGVKKNAAEEGIRCAYVVIEYREGGGHAIVAFDTTDRGPIFVEPQFDWEVEPEIGRSYHECVVVPPGYQLSEPDYDDTILRIIIIW